MTEINPLLHDLALILMVAGIVTVIFRALKQPVVLGYVVAGMLTGPFITLIPTVTEVESVEFWGKIGVVFLLFGLGLELNFKKLKKVGGTGFMTVFAEVLLMFSVGYLVGWFMGWSVQTSLFLGGMLTISSTSIIIKAFNDLGLKNRKFAQLVFGTLVVEDLVAILLLVLLPAFAISSNFDGGELASKVANLALFLLFWFTGGVFLIPTMLKKLAKYLTDETLIVISLGLCLLMVVITVNAGISEALGAFVMGSILSGTQQSHKITKLIAPLQDFFAAIFFVSVGMLVDPTIVITYWAEILLISLIVILIKPFSALLGLLFAGHKFKIALNAGLCLCQIGEFSFIIAGVGKELESIPDFVYPVIVAVSIITTFITPYWIKMGDGLYAKIYRISRPQWRVVIDKLGSGKRLLDREGDWNKLIKSYVIRVSIYTGWLFFITIFCTQFLAPVIEDRFGDSIYSRAALLVINILAISPFLYALLRRKDSDGLYNKIWNDRKFFRGPLLFLMLLKYIIAVMALSFLSSYYLAIGAGALLIICAVVITVVILSGKIKSYYSIIESTFLTNLNSERGRKGIELPKEFGDELHFDFCDVESNSFLAGKTISQIHRSKSTGALIIRIHRGGLTIDLPSKTEILLPADTIDILGTDKQVSEFRVLSESENGGVPAVESDEMELFQLTIREGSPLVGMAANLSDIRNRFGVLMIAFEEGDNDVYIKPTSANIFEVGDAVWVVGPKEMVKQL